MNQREQEPVNANTRIKLTPDSVLESFLSVCGCMSSVTSPLPPEGDSRTSQTETEGFWQKTQTEQHFFPLTVCVRVCVCALERQFMQNVRSNQIQNRTGSGGENQEMEVSPVLQKDKNPKIRAGTQERQEKSSEYYVDSPPRLVLDKLEQLGFRVISMTGVGQTLVWCLHKERKFACTHTSQRQKSLSLQHTSGKQEHKARHNEMETSQRLRSQITAGFSGWILDVECGYFKFSSEWSECVLEINPSKSCPVTLTE
ncbi:hypothetical protein DNTS_022796 [Danionella cerebrum]|uniref:GTP cyclohydrolase 1 feedback regulatory protein n=1 Tax=Danionella cerebrum TaxID=2873325 RepID=A0A553MTM7_9TELE|nr:hypothetical protein DNTS_022796 [Danionella translucida]